MSARQYQCGQMMTFKTPCLVHGARLTCEALHCRRSARGLNLQCLLRSSRVFAVVVGLECSAHLPEQCMHRISHCQLETGSRLVLQLCNRVFLRARLFTAQRRRCASFLVEALQPAGLCLAGASGASPKPAPQDRQMAGRLFTPEMGTARC